MDFHSHKKEKGIWNIKRYSHVDVLFKENKEIMRCFLLVSFLEDYSFIENSRSLFPTYFVVSYSRAI
jgi:hypothetical protein